VDRIKQHVDDAGLLLKSSVMCANFGGVEQAISVRTSANAPHLNTERFKRICS
jgi:hypothetical protein